MSRETKSVNDSLELYNPPFKYQYGYIFDRDNNTVADMDSIDGEKRLVLRIRGWGRISYYKNAEALQDEIGEHIAKALTEYWVKEQAK